MPRVMAKEGRRRSLPDDCWDRARRLIADWGDERRAIPMLLDIAWLLTQPTCPELDEPVAAAKARAERARAHNVRALSLIYRDQIGRGEVDERIRRFFAEQAELRIWSAADPIAAMGEFLGLSPRRLGAPRRTAARNFYLAADIQELIDEGNTVDSACGAVFERLDTTGHELDPQTLRNIYFRETRGKLNKKAIEAEVRIRDLCELQALRRKATTDRLDSAEEQREMRLQQKIEAWQASFNARTMASDSNDNSPEL
jgi:hypothetical protein